MGRARFTKTYAGPIKAASVVEFMHASVGAVESGVYVALERVAGTVEGRRGTFALHHLGLRERGTSSLAIHVVPDSGTGELVGLRGAMSIDIVDGKHFYTFDYELAGPP